MNELDDTVRKMSGSTNATVESVGFARALKDMDYASINFNDKDEVQKTIDEFAQKADAARKTINDAWNSQVLDLQNTKQQYINLGVDVEFDAKFGKGKFDELFADAEKTLNAGYGSELKKIDIGQGTFLQMVQNQYDKNAEAYAQAKFDKEGPGFGSTFKNFFTSGGLGASGASLYHTAMNDYEKSFRCAKHNK